MGTVTPSIDAPVAQLVGQSIGNAYNFAAVTCVPARSARGILNFVW